MSATDWLVTTAFVLAVAGGVFALERTAARHERIAQLVTERDNEVGRWQAARRALRHAEAQLKEEPDNPNAELIRGIYGGFVDRHSVRIAVLDTQISHLRDGE